MKRLTLFLCIVFGLPALAQEIPTDGLVLRLDPNALTAAMGTRIGEWRNASGTAVFVQKDEALRPELAILRRDGFASMDAGGSEGTLTTRPVTFKGRHLFVNTDCPGGRLKVEILNPEGAVIAPFTLDNCVAVSCDNTKTAVTWKGSNDLSSLSGKPVQFRFHLTGGSLYSFWVSPDDSGASHGYVAAGGPGWAGPMDTTGRMSD